MVSNNSVIGEVSRLQAGLFCSQLHIELARLEHETTALQATLARQEARVDLRRHAVTTEGDLMRATAEADHIVKMLAAMGHPYPCKHGDEPRSAHSSAAQS